MAKKKADEVKESLGLEKRAQNFYSGKDTYVPPKEGEPTGNKKTVIGVIEAEKLQKSGWRQISCRRTSDDPFGDKTYIYERNK